MLYIIANKVYSSVYCESQNEERLFPWTELNDCLGNAGAVCFHTKTEPIFCIIIHLHFILQMVSTFVFEIAEGNIWI
jgi:hypothetical protein